MPPPQGGKDAAEAVEEATKRKDNEDAGTRTRDQRIKSQLLYQLSYILNFSKTCNEGSLLCSCRSRRACLTRKVHFRRKA